MKIELINLKNEDKKVKQLKNKYKMKKDKEQLIYK